MELIAIDSNPIPDGASCFSLVPEKGVTLRVATWVAKGAAKGTVTLVQGRSEFIEKYFEVIEELRSRGFHVVAFDLRGQGGSSRLLKSQFKGHIRAFSEYKEDLRVVLEDVALARFPGPHYLLGHSTGCSVILDSAARLRTQVERVVLSSPLVEIKLPKWGRKPARWLARIMVACGLGAFYVPGGSSRLVEPFQGNKLTSDGPRYQRMVDILTAKPELGVGSPTAGWFHRVSAALQRIRSVKFARQDGPPTLVVASGADRIVCKQASETLCRYSSWMAYLEVRGAQHELLMEQDKYRSQFWAAFDAFVPLDDAPPIMSRVEETV
ncbi:alpha/beta hydrolase [Polycladidibacter hongkongensis]|uniref:alpha/beta hydrolase n=1 Tax=Polycladidibacter hongkongensis TaxID=1647556 RepID=UPI00083288EB|nr:alpha/beta hydrolase [Pseudovibrio hongkongensis]